MRQTQGGTPGWLVNGMKMWTTGMHVATHCALFARTSGKDGDARGITCFLVPADAPGVKIEEYLWTFNMPTDHPRVSFTDVWVPDAAVLGRLDQGLAVAQHFVHENRIRQAASSLGAAVYCIDESVRYARRRKPFGKALAENQAIQWPLVELATQAEMLRLLIRKTAWEMDQMSKPEVEKRLSDKVSMCNYWANRLVCEAADRAMQIHGGIGYSRHKPFEHIYRHHRRYRITEGSEEIQMRKVAGHLFGFMGPRRAEFAAREAAAPRNPSVEPGRRAARFRGRSRGGHSPRDRRRDRDRGLARLVGRRRPGELGLRGRDRCRRGAAGAPPRPAGAAARAEIRGEPRRGGAAPASRGGIGRSGAAGACRAPPGGRGG